MSVSTYTNTFMKSLPAALRPNPFNIDEDVMLAVQNGWNPEKLARACYEMERNPTPAFVVTNLRNLCKYGPTQQNSSPKWTYGHTICTEPGHDPACELCRCVPGEITHHIPSNPNNPTSAALRKLLRP